MKKYTLAPYVRTGFRNNQLSIGYGSIQWKVEGEELVDAAISILEACKSDLTQEEIRQKWDDVSKELDTDVRKGFIEKFLTSSYLIEAGSYQRSERYSRNHLYYGLSGGNSKKVQESLKEKKILILGCGGIGNCMSYQLATAGVGKLILMDSDVIEESNLSRQFLFTTNDLNKPKIERAKEAILERNPEIEVETLEKTVTCEKDLESVPEGIDLIVLSADTPGEIIFWVNRYCVKHGIPYINVGYVEDIALWGPFVIPGETGCFSCNDVIAKTKTNKNYSLKEINQGYQAPSIGPINMIASSLATMDILRYFGQYGEIQSLNKRCGLWTHDLKLETQNCERVQDCTVCGG